MVIAGGSSDTSEFENEMKELAKEDKRILFTGFVQGQELEELYSNAYDRHPELQSKWDNVFWNRGY